VLAQLWRKVFAGDFEEIEPVLPGLFVIIIDLAAVDVAEDALEPLRAVIFELNRVLLAFLGACQQRDQIRDAWLY
jgi:hypothetical protein